MTKHRPFRFGISVSGARSRAAWKAKAQKIEALGFSTLLVSEHLFGELAPLAALAVAAEATETIRLGTLVLANDFRHPVILAREAATIDLLSEGRLELGLGTGWLRSDYEQSGIPFDTPAIRVSRLEEAIQVIKGMFSDEPVTFSGSYYNVSSLNGLPKPVQRPSPPILIGGGSKRTLSIAAREADIVSVNVRTTAEGGTDPASTTADATMRKMHWIREAAKERREYPELNILVTASEVTHNRRGAADGMVRGWKIPGPRPGIEELLASPATLIGSVDEIIEDLQVLRERYGFSYIVLREPIDRFAPVIERLSGT